MKSILKSVFLLALLVPVSLGAANDPELFSYDKAVVDNSMAELNEMEAVVLQNDEHDFIVTYA